MNIFGTYLSPNFIKIYSKTHHIKHFLGEACPQTPLASAVTQPAQTQKKVAPPPGNSCISPWVH